MVLNYSPAVTIREWQQQEHRRRGGEVQEEEGGLVDEDEDDGGGGGEQSAKAPGKSDRFAESECLPTQQWPLFARLNPKVFSLHQRG